MSSRFHTCSTPMTFCFSQTAQTDLCQILCLCLIFIKNRRGSSLILEKRNLYWRDSTSRMQQIARISGIQRRQFSLMYLGVPIFMGRAKLVPLMPWFIASPLILDLRSLSRLARLWLLIFFEKPRLSVVLRCLILSEWIQDE